MRVRPAVDGSGLESYRSQRAAERGKRRLQTSRRSDQTPLLAGRRGRSALRAASGKQSAGTRSCPRRQEERVRFVTLRGGFGQYLEGVGVSCAALCACSWELG